MKLFNTKVTIAKTYFKGKHFLEIEGMLEFDQNGYPEDIVFFRIFEDMEFRNKEKQYAMQLTSTDIRDLCEACRELILCKCKSIEYKKETRKSPKSTMKSLKVGAVSKEDSWTYYINIETGRKKAAVSFNKYQIRTFVKKIEFLAQKVEESLYAYQKMLSLTLLKHKEQQNKQGR
ncbi:MAG TPA: hypothetical protein EYP60_03910 [bacterium (Candidatus Stahlbacteria)]|nr:hypothetical protein [Candidatus Stahlbacteria bacterium]